jgi:WD40 repeat protein
MVLVVTLDMQGDTGFVLSVAFSPDGRTLASSNMGKIMNLKLWDVASGRILRSLQGRTDDVHSVVFSPVGVAWCRGAMTNPLSFGMSPAVNYFTILTTSYPSAHAGNAG